MPPGFGVGKEMEIGGECLVDFFLPKCRSLSMATGMDGWMKGEERGNDLVGVWLSFCLSVCLSVCLLRVSFVQE